jgi:hypothetical protein
MGIRDRPISPASPWQNGYVELLTRSNNARQRLGAAVPAEGQQFERPAAVGLELIPGGDTNDH